MRIVKETKSVLPKRKLERSHRHSAVRLMKEGSLQRHHRSAGTHARIWEADIKGVLYKIISSI